ncbi:SAM-dependent MidA family methyltransferase [Thermosulfuriphilus ammonigenes]|nr:SAM-dependent MidA family methyltransferase [Thermosulfuriphilus ammonigenes]
MQWALYHPEEGYYSRPGRIGKTGDYYTSPHVHPAFGAALALETETLWKALGCPENFTVMELGAGEGYLARDFLSSLIPELAQTITYVIVEPRRKMIPTQKARLDGPWQVQWLLRPEEAGEITGVILSNEVFDALPVHLVEKRGSELKEVYVSAESGRIFEVLGPLSSEEFFSEVAQFFPRWPEGYRTELHPASRQLLTTLAKVLKRGLIITIDYGYPEAIYYAPYRARGTLMSYWRHRLVEDPYQRVGEQDITAHVNFSALKRWGEPLGLEPLGFIPQGTYLVSVGLEKILSRLPPQGPKEMNQLKLLIFPQGLGESHSVFLQKKGDFAYHSPGLAIRNRLHLL